MTLHPSLEAMLRTMPWVGIRRAPLRERGRFYPEHAAVLIQHGLRGGAYTATLMHELIHAERGDEPCVSPELEARQELAVAREAARRLITIERLVDALLWCQDDRELADVLDVDNETVRVRLAMLSAEEHAFIDRRLWAAEGQIA